jgi:hypothetical protein
MELTPAIMPCRRTAHIPHNLDLLNFPTIFFVQTGYSIYTLQQASRRSWRIGQSNGCVMWNMSRGGALSSSLKPVRPDTRLHQRPQSESWRSR